MHVFPFRFGASLLDLSNFLCLLVDDIRANSILSLEFLTLLLQDSHLSELIPLFFLCFENLSLCLCKHLLYILDISFEYLILFQQILILFFQSLLRNGLSIDIRLEFVCIIFYPLDMFLHLLFLSENAFTFDLRIVTSVI